MFQKEYDDIVMADHSDLGWNTVKQFRGDFGIPDDYSSCGRGTVGSGGSVSDGGAIKRGKSCFKCGSHEHLIANCKQ